MRSVLCIVSLTVPFRVHVLSPTTSLGKASFKLNLGRTCTVYVRTRDSDHARLINADRTLETIARPDV